MALQPNVAKAIVALVIVCMIIWGLKTSYTVYRSSTPTARQVTSYSGPSIKESCTEGGKKLENCSIVDTMVKRLVVATGISSNHYQEAMAGLIGSVQRMMPKTKIIVYDLGLTAKQRDNVRRICDVELRTFNFPKYPDHVSPRTLNNYAWKPLIAAELSEEYEMIMYGDSSVRLLEPLQKHVFPHFLDVELPFVGTLAITHQVSYN